MESGCLRRDRRGSQRQRHCHARERGYIEAEEKSSLRHYGRRPSSAHQTRPFGIELPAWYEELHGRRIVTRAQAVGVVELVCALDCIEIEIDAEARALRHFDEPFFYLK